MANAPPRATPVSLRLAAAKAEEVTITYAGHSTYYIESRDGVRIATDYSGAYRTGRLPDVVTMNRAHSTHYSLSPDRGIAHVLHGWGDDGKPAYISQRIGDVYIRNVTTDIRPYYQRRFRTARWSGTATRSSSSRSPASASAISATCTTSSTTAISPQIGRIDILMVPIDGTYTMSLDGISEITRRLRSSVVLPMHRFMTPLDDFMQRIGQQFEIDRRGERTLKISRETLPATPTVIILDGV